MTVEAALPNTALLEVIRTLSAELEAQRKSADEARREIARLVRMVVSPPPRSGAKGSPNALLWRHGRDL